MCAKVCVRERERERGGEGGKERERERKKERHNFLVPDLTIYVHIRGVKGGSFVT